MPLTDDELQAKRERNAEAQAELDKVNAERIAAENAAANDSAGELLDREYERIQAAIAQATKYNETTAEKPAEEKAAEKPVEKPAVVAQTPSRPVNAEEGK